MKGLVLIEEVHTKKKINSGYTTPPGNHTGCGLMGLDPGGGGGTTPIKKCPNVCVGYLKMHPFRRTLLVLKHTHIEWILCPILIEILR